MGPTGPQCPEGPQELVGPAGAIGPRGAASPQGVVGPTKVPDGADIDVLVGITIMNLSSPTTLVLPRDMSGGRYLIPRVRACARAPDRLVSACSVGACPGRD